MWFIWLETDLAAPGTLLTPPEAIALAALDRSRSGQETPKPNPASWERMVPAENVEEHSLFPQHKPLAVPPSLFFLRNRSG